MVVEKYDCGWKCAMNEADAKALIEKITWDVIKEKKNYAVAAKNHFGWHLEEPVLLNVYKQLRIS